MCRNWFKSRHLQKVILPVLLLLAVMSTGNICTAQEPQPVAMQRGEQDLHQPIRVRIFTLRNITAEQAKDYLRSAQIADTVLAIPGTTAISVTGSPEQLVQASTVIKLVDANEKFDVQFLDITPNKTLPAAEKIETQLGQGYSVGSLMEGPAPTAVVKAIACSYEDKLLIITPQEQTNKITETVQSCLVSAFAEASSDKEKQAEAEPNQQSLQQTPQAQPKVASANDVVSTGSPQVVFAKEPLVVEPNKTQAAAPAGVTIEPDRPKAEDDMLGDFLTELAETAKTEKAERAAQKVKTESNQLGQIAAEPNVQQPKIAEQQPAKQIEQTKAVADFGELSRAAEAKEPAVPLLDIPNGEEMLELNLPEKLEIVALIDLVGKYLNLNYLYDETKVTGSVTIKVQGKLRVRELYDLLESVLKFRGFIMSRKGKLVTIVPSAEVLEQDPTFAAGIKPGDVVVTKFFHLQYITTAAAKNLLNGMKLGTNTTEIPESGTLVITEYAFRMQRIEDLLAIVDVSGPPKEFKLRILSYTLAEALVPKIQALAEQLGTVNITVGTTTPSPMPAPTPRGRPRQPAQPQQAPTTESAKKTAVYIDFDKRTNRILMIGLANEVAAVEQIIDSLDVPQQDLRIVREYEIQYVDIDKIVEAMKEFGIVESAGTPSAPTARPAGAAPAPQGATAIISLDQPQIVKLETTNSLLVNATPEQHIQISRVISYIDREPVEAAIPYRIYRLENQEPEALAEVLNGLIEKTVKDKEGKIQQTVKYTEESIAIVPDKNTFSLIVYASRKNQEWIGNLIQTLDKRRPQVLIDVSLVEITRDDRFQFDLDVVANARDLVQNSLVVTPESVNPLFPATSPSKSIFEGGYFIGATKSVRGFYNEGRIQVLFDLIDKKGYGRILARPKILVNDNELGKIERTETEYVAQTTTTALPGQTQTDTVQTSTTYSPYQARISLEITPQISEGELLRLEIKMTREDFDDTSGAGGTPKNTTTTNIDTIVTVPDGSTIILGGLTKLNQTKTSNKVPLLGDIPIAGTLFRSTGNVDKGNKLYVFVKANILRPEQTLGLNELKHISKMNRDEFEKAESKFQQHEHFPGIKPEPLEPEKVLEQEVEESNEPEMLSRK